jgi:hypothetical protein
MGMPGFTADTAIYVTNNVYCRARYGLALGAGVIKPVIGIGYRGGILRLPPPPTFLPPGFSYCFTAIDDDGIYQRVCCDETGSCEREQNPIM